MKSNLPFNFDEYMQDFSHIKVEDFNGKEAVLLLYKDYLFDFGELESDREVKVLDLRNKKTQRVPFENPLPAGTGYHVCSWTEDKFVIIGGPFFIDEGNFVCNIEVVSIILKKKKHKTASGDVEVESLSFDRSKKTTANPPSVIHKNAMHIYKDNLYTFGTEAGNFIGGIVLLKLNLETFAWERVLNLDGKPIETNSNTKGVFYKNKLNLCQKSPDGYIIVDDKRVERLQKISTWNLDNLSCLEILPPRAIPFSKKTWVYENGGIIYFINGALDLWVFDISKLVIRNSFAYEIFSSVEICSVKSGNRVVIWKVERNTKDLCLITLGPSETKEKNEVLKTKDQIPSTKNQSSQEQMSFLMRKLFSDRLFTDIHFIVESQAIPAHRCVLLQCQFFENLLKNGGVENEEKQIPVPDISAASFWGILEFIYCGTVQLDENLASDLIVQAEKYYLPELKTLCEAKLLECLKMENVVYMAQLAEKVGAAKLQDLVAKFIITNCDNLEHFVNITELPRRIFLKAVQMQKNQPFILCNLLQSEKTL